MAKNKKILIGILVIIILVIGGLWVLNNHCNSDDDCKSLSCPNIYQLGCTSVHFVAKECTNNKCQCKCKIPYYDLPKSPIGNDVEYGGEVYIKTEEKYDEYISDDFIVELEDGSSIYLFNDTVYSLYAADPAHSSYIYVKWIKKMPEATITTDKTEYEQGEVIKITVKNNLNKNICFEWCNTYYIEKKNTEWETDLQSMRFCEINYVGECLKPEDSKIFEFETVSEIYTKEKGVYRAVVSLYTEDFKQESTIYSNEFTIK